MQVKVVRKNSSTKLPERMSKGAAGYDIYSYHDYLIQPGHSAYIDTELSFEIPEGYFFSLVPRSSLGKKGVIIPNSPATIDEDYRGTIRVILYNMGNEPYSVKKGDRVAQLILMKYQKFDFLEVTELESTQRGEGGFGSTGT